ncbi:acyl-CoA dehydrogenase family protein [Rhodococcus sp. MSC1_016]|jgi:alkylation response protein AidB-like acyl-CoA dehydrogenase|uniref:acyl-CoA dehydrogenase family protein n=1 Tax=Rhodococcus sp. MSC1_016 TaxID=2909266 RepID=UPI00202FCA5F|nr:acyl-CoA dehydrogenase family protein [Rhodococcus sp. MSC1_016]
MPTHHFHPWPEAEPPAMTPVAEHDDIRAVVRQLLDRHSTLENSRLAAESDAGYSPELWSLLVKEMSVAALAVPEHCGGLGYSVVELGIVLEECGRALVCEPVLPSATLGVRALLTADGCPQVDELLGRVMQGELVATVTALGEHTDFADVARVDDRWSVSGRATNVVQGGAADIVVLLGHGEDGPGLYAVDLRTTSVRRMELPVIDPSRRQANLLFDAADAVRLVGPGDARRKVEELRSLGVIGLACEHVGMIDRLLDTTREYTMQRRQFGRAIGSFQAVKHRLANILVELEKARSAARYAAAVFAEDPGAAPLPAAVAGAVCTEAVIATALEAVQLHGGVGFTWEHAAHSYVRRALGDEPLLGDARAHRSRIADLVGV